MTLFQCWLWATLALLWGTPVQAAPYTPAADSVVIERLPFRTGDTTARELAALRSQVDRAPSDQAPAVDLAHK